MVDNSRAFSGYDQWKTTDPFDDCCEADLCAVCCEALTESCTEPDEEPWQDEGYCSRACQECAQNTYLPAPRGMLEVLQEELCVELPEPRQFSAEYVEHVKRYWDTVSRRIYKATNCGAWLAPFDRSENGDGEFGVTVGSIVEGVDYGAEPVALCWPFTGEQLMKAVENVEQQCQTIWMDTHGCDDCNAGEGETGYPCVNPDCESCGGEGVAI